MKPRPENTEPALLPSDPRDLDAHCYEACKIQVHGLLESESLPSATKPRQRREV